MTQHHGIGLRLRRLVVILAVCFAMGAQAEPLPLKRAVELALAHATVTGISAADTQHAFANYRESRDNYIPQFIF
ncbi:MAG TPA: hypothetical protein VK466_13915, partial [Terriglobales bacterium]|nr:hypothetical protein [Terriglobales bacterium]